MLEYLLLRAGFFDLTAANLRKLYVCDSHKAYLLRVPVKNRCRVCRVISSRSKSGQAVRRVSKLLSFGLWLDHRTSLYDQWMCDTCRRELQRRYYNDDLRLKTDQLFAWLSDVRYCYSASSVSSEDSTYQSYLDEPHPLTTTEKRTRLKQWLKDNEFKGRVDSTLSYNDMKNDKSRRNFRTQVKAIFLEILGLLAPNDVTVVWDDIIADEIENGKPKNNE